MEYLSASQAAQRLWVSTRRVQQMCVHGELDGAVKQGKAWRIPISALPSDAQDTDVLRLPIGVSDYKKAISEYYYVDKTGMIKEFLDIRPQVSLFTRPRRFGKSLNMDMMKTFFEISEEDTSGYFQDKSIWRYGEAYRSHQGKYPVL